jgi:hypothetical protein
MLFILAMEPLQRMLAVAMEEGQLSKIENRAATARMSMYADDVGLFINPIKQEVKALSDMLSDFGAASGLLANVNKSAVYPIQCDGLDVEQIIEDFGCPILQFPCTYLGLPLHTRALRRVDFQPLIDKIGGRLAGWKGRFLNKAGRLTLVNMVLTSIPAYFLSFFILKKWAIKRIDKL